MKVRTIELGADEMPESVTVTMTVDEAALMYAFVGRVAPKTVTDATNDTRWGNALYDIAEALSGSFFNRFWDDGANDVAPRLNLTPPTG